MEKITPEAKNLYGALKRRNIECKMEAEHLRDHHKHVDICIDWAKIDIEVDGLQHFTNAKQILSDFNREHYSDHNDHHNTIHVPNIIIHHYLNEVADAIAEAARIQYKKIQKYRENKKHV